MHRWVLVVLLCLAGCASSRMNEWYAGALSSDGAAGGYIETRRGVRIAYRGSPGDFLPGWTTDNLYFDSEQRIWRLKRTDDYVVLNVFDLDGDDRPDKRRWDLIYDLRVIHDASGGVIWVQSVPVSTLLGRRDIDVVLFDYLDAVGGAAFRGLGSGRSFGSTGIRVDDNPALISGMAAHAATLEMGDADRVQMDPTAREARARIILVRTPYTDSGSTDGQPGPLPVLMLLGYWNRPERYEAGLADFEALVRGITIQGSPDTSAFEGILPVAGVPPS